MEQKIDYKELRRFIDEKKTAKEIMGKFTLKTKVSLRNAVHRLMVEDEKLYTVVGLFDNGRSVHVRFNKGGVRIPPSRLEKRGFSEKDEFDIEFDDNKIVLNKVA